MARIALIPPAASGPWYWHLLTAELTARGHEVIPVFLPYDSDTALLADYVAAAVEQIGRSPGCVVVAQSFGRTRAPSWRRTSGHANSSCSRRCSPRPGKRPPSSGICRATQPPAVVEADREGWSTAEDSDAATIFFHELPDSLVEKLTHHAIDHTDSALRRPVAAGPLARTSPPPCCSPRATACSPSSTCRN
ncbi:hypothetical protein QP028_13075 [Corynebacterium suedekumii]|nr:hypothetical protein QP028_13075 [Corynebacterium suedekumii]